MTSVQKLGFYATPPHNCNYLSSREAVTLFADPRFPKNTRLYTALAECGFRRSGEHLYIPHCNGCSSCVPVRLSVQTFRPNRSQRRCWRQNHDLEIHQLPAEYNAEHFALYQDYIAARHVGGGMDDPTPESYMEFLKASWSETLFFEFRLQNKLLAVAVTDMMVAALSAVYTFFDPDYEHRSLGRYSILYQVDYARRHQYDYLYLGYWIAACRKMSYKQEYRPIEYYIDNEWRYDPPNR